MQSCELSFSPAISLLGIHILTDSMKCSSILRKISTTRYGSCYWLFLDGLDLNACQEAIKEHGVLEIGGELQSEAMNCVRALGTTIVFSGYNILDKWVLKTDVPTLWDS